MARFVNVGFDREGDAKRFLELVTGNGNLITLGRKVDGAWKLSNLQARSVHSWDPKEMDARTYKYPGVVLEFESQVAATNFVSAVGEVTALTDVQDIYRDGVESDRDEPLLERVTPLFAEQAVRLALQLIDVAGIRLERK